MTTTDTQTTLPIRHEEPTPMMLLQQAMESDSTDVAKLEKLMDLQRQWKQDQAADDFAEAMALFQDECPAVIKSRSASFGGKSAYTFASLDDIMHAIRPLLSKHGLTVSFSADIRDGMIRVVCKVRRGRHVEESETTLPVPSDMRVNDTQKMGAAMSYAKRYALCAALNITVTDRDDDGAGLTDKTITDEQAITLSEMCDGLPEGTLDGMLAWLGVASVYNIPASRFGECKALLKKKRQKAGLS